MKASDLHDRGLAIGSYNLMDFSWYFRFYDEMLTVKNPALDDKRPSRCINIFSLPELRYGRVAKIEEVRICAEKA